MSHSIQIAGSELRFDCAAGQTVLDAALQAGIELPYSCRKGVCGSCAGGVAAGQVTPVSGVTAHPEHCPPGQQLYCACTPAGDLVIAPATYRKLDPGARKTLQAKVYRHALAAPDVSLLQLRFAAGQRVRFAAGQYLQVLLEDGSRRSFSMANAPHESDGVTLHIRHVPGGRFTAKLPAMAAGDLVRVELPYGSFVLDGSSVQPLVFVAGGTGFAPVKSMLDDLMRRGVQRPVRLFWGARRREGLYLLEAVERWRKFFRDFAFVPALADEVVEGMHRGPVHEALAAHAGPLAGQALYCCGSPPMVDAVRATALSQGLAPADFHADVFVS